ncbi:Mss4-like protein [Schizophyllum commune]
MAGHPSKTTGSCLCGAVRFTFSGKPTATCLCHCLDCRKISGSTYSTNAMFPIDAVTLTSGTPKGYTTHGVSGKPITNFFCGDCGSTLWRESVVFAGLRIVKAGVLDDVRALEIVAAPAMELFVEHRVGWVQQIHGAVQKEGQ